MTEGEQVCSNTRLVTETRYVVTADSTDLFAFTSSRGDSLLNGIARCSNPSTYISDTINAQWVRRWKYMPYDAGTIAIGQQDTSSICLLKQDDIKALLLRETDNIIATLRITDEQQADIEYFLRTHTVIDDGFDIVARYGKALNHDVDSIKTALELTNKATAFAGKSKGGKVATLSIRLDRRYYLITDSGRVECEPLPYASAKGLLLLKTSAQKPRKSILTRQPSCQQARLLLKSRHPKVAMRQTSEIDSLGTYEGERDSIARPHGYGRFLALNGDFYEGEWQHGQRSGVGFSIIPGQRLRLGEWKENTFLGERIAYTPERIYGIDISRHQHEKGRKRYSIDWRDLRITSLGTKSKKNIKGVVDYPVRFVYIKATEGVTIKNRYFASDYAASRKHGYKTGAYHFYSVRTSGKAQAANFLKYSRYTYGDLPPVLDLEPTDAQIRQAGGIQSLFKHVRVWLNAVERKYGVRPILYVSQRFVNKYLPSAPDLMRNYDVWIARYGEYKPDVNLIYWQLSPDGRVKGIHGEVDINVLNGFSL